jgi:hypothetical protein
MYVARDSTATSPRSPQSETSSPYIVINGQEVLVSQDEGRDGVAKSVDEELILDEYSSLQVLDLIIT